MYQKKDKTRQIEKKTFFRIQFLDAKEGFS